MRDKRLQVHLNDTRTLPLQEVLRGFPLPADHFAILRLQLQESLALKMVQGNSAGVSHTITEGMGLQLYTKDGRSSFISTDKLSVAALEQGFSTALTLMESVRGPHELSFASLFSASPTTGSRLLNRAWNPRTTPANTIRDSILGMHLDLSSRDPSNRSVTSFSAVDDEWRIFSTDGTDVHFSTPRSLLRHNSSRWASGKCFTLGVTLVGSDLGLIFDEKPKNTFKKRVKVQLELLQELVEAPPVPCGSYPLLIDAHLTGGLVHEAFGHAAESDTVHRGSVLAEAGRFRKGLRVGPESLTIVDGPLEHDWGDQPFSVNGFPRKTVAIVERGILRQALADELTAGFIGVDPTGAARAQDFSCVPIPRMSNIRLEISGTVPWEVELQDVSAQELYDFLLAQDVISRSEEHLFLSGYRGGQVNTTSGDFVFQCALIYRLKDGAARLCKPAIFSGNIFDVLNSIHRGIGKQHVRRWGMCGKLGQKVPTSGGGPAFLLLKPHSDIRIGGT